MIEKKIPGKLYIAGEYAVVEPGEPAVLVAVDRFLRVRLKESSGEGRVSSSEYGRTPKVWVRDQLSGRIVVEHQPLDYVFAALSLIEQLRASMRLQPRYYDLEIESELDDSEGRKFGLGSSAAVTVAVIAALDEFYGLALSRMQLFKLALLATIEVAPTASGGDVAASTFGGWIRYTSPDRQALRMNAMRFGVREALDSDLWAGCGITRLPEPLDLQLLVGWTGSPASTERLVERMRQADVEFARRYAEFIASSRACVDELVECLSAGDSTGAQAMLRSARGLLRELSSAAGVSIETEQLRALCDSAEKHGAAAKLSGAGGGDCGIVLAPKTLPLTGLLEDWEHAGVKRLGMNVYTPKGQARVH